MSEQLTAEDGTPVADILADLAERRAEIARLKVLLRTIHNMTNAPHWTAERRWKIRDMTTLRNVNGTIGV